MADAKKLVSDDSELADILGRMAREDVFVEGLIVMKALDSRVLDWFLKNVALDARMRFILPHEMCLALYGPAYNSFYMTERMIADAKVYGTLAKLNVLGLGSWSENVFILRLDWLEWLRTF